MSRNQTRVWSELPELPTNVVPFPTSVTHRAPRVPAQLQSDDEDAAFDTLASALGRLWRFQDALDVAGPRLDPLAREDGAWFRTVLHDSVVSVGILLTGECGSDLIAEVSNEIRDREARLEAIRVALLNRVDPMVRRVLTEAEAESSANRETIRAEAVRRLLQDFHPELEVEPGSPGLTIDVTSLIHSVEQDLFERYEHLEIPSRRGLRTLLKALPVYWLDAVADAHQIVPGGRRRDREAEIVGRLTEPEELGWLLEGLTPDATRLLGTLVEAGGMLTVQAYKAQFDASDDGAWWGLVPPTSALGQLRLHGLVFVGDHQGEQVLVVPAEVVGTLGAARPAR